MKRAAIFLLFGSMVLAAPAAAQEQEADTVSQEEERPFVRGGIYDKPYMGRLFGRTAIGGYVEGNFAYERVDGVTENLGFDLRRLNLFLASQVSDFVRFAAELEIEEGGEEIKVEFAAVDLILNRAFTLRGGIILVPLGRFNLSHDSPLNDFVERPLVATEIGTVALSEPGAGALGSFGLGGNARLTYELYLVNGFDEGLLAEEGTRIPEGRQPFGNNNNELSVVGRVAYSPALDWEFGLSAHHGAYNASTVDGMKVAERQDLTIWVLDLEATPLGFRIYGEASTAAIDIPQNLSGIYASDQAGLYLDVLYDFGRGWLKLMPRSLFTAGLRYDYLDFDSDLDGDDVSQLTLGINFRPTVDTVFKFDYVRGRSHDRFNNASDFALLLASVATYF